MKNKEMFDKILSEIDKLTYVENSEYQQKQEKKINRYKELAQINEDKSISYYNQSLDIRNDIVLGQPILTDHYSSKKHRNAIKKMDNKMRKNIEAQETAEHYQQKIDSAVTNCNIYDDDPNALILLKQNYIELAKKQELMKIVNKEFAKIKKNNQSITIEEMTQELLTKFGEEVVKSYKLNLNCWGDNAVPFEIYRLRNNNSQMKRLEKRIISLWLRKQQKTQEKTKNGIKVVDNVEENRIQVYFDDIPDKKVIVNLKLNGFKARKIGHVWIWQRYRNSRIYNNIFEIIESK